MKWIHDDIFIENIVCAVMATNENKYNHKLDVRSK